VSGSREIRAGKAAVEVYLKDRKLNAGLDRMQMRLRTAARAAATAGSGMVLASATLLAPLLGAANEFAKTGDALDKMSKRTGVSVEALSEMGFAAEQSGTDLTQLGNAMFRMTRRIGNATTETGPAVRALKELGLSASELSNMDAEQQFLTLTDALGRVPNDARRAQLAFEVFGDNARQLMPLLNEGSVGIEALRKRARELGLTLTGEDAAAAAQLTDSMNELKRSLHGAWLQVGGALAPSLSGLAKAFGNAAGRVSHFIRENRGLVMLAAKAAAVLGGAGVAVLGWAGALKVASIAVGALSPVLGVLSAAVGVVGSVLGAIVSPVGVVVAAIAGGIYLWTQWTEAGQQAVGALGKAWNVVAGIAMEALGTAKQVFGGIVDALRVGDLKLAARIAWSGVQVIVLQAYERIRSQWGRLTGAVGEVWGAIKKQAAGVWTWISGVWSKLPGVIAKVMAAVKNTVGVIGQFLAGVLGGPLIVSQWGRLTAAAGQAWGFIQDRAAGVWSWISGVWSRLADVIAGPLGSIRDSVGALGQYLAAALGEPLQDLGGIFGETFQGVVDAVSTGDWGAAGEIIMNGIKAAWQTGVAALQKIWGDFTSAMIEAFAGAAIAVQRLWTDTQDRIAQGILDLASEEGIVGSVARKVLGVDMRAEDARNEKLEREGRQARRRSLETQHGELQGRLAAAELAGDQGEIERYTKAIARNRSELESIGGPIESATEQAKRLVHESTRAAQEAFAGNMLDMASNAQLAANLAAEASKKEAQLARERLQQSVQEAADKRGLSEGRSRLEVTRAELAAAIAEAAAASERAKKEGDRWKDRKDGAGDVASRNTGTFSGYRLGAQFQGQDLNKKQLAELKQINRGVEKLNSSSFSWGM